MKPGCAPPPTVCPHCGLAPHLTPQACPRVGAVEYYPTGEVKRVEYRQGWAPRLGADPLVGITK